jgi:hypothetical protein
MNFHFGNEIDRGFLSQLDAESERTSSVLNFPVRRSIPSVGSDMAGSPRVGGSTRLSVTGNYQRESVITHRLPLE